MLLGLIVFWLASVTGAYFKGHQNAQDAARAHYATELETSIKAANETAQADIAAAREAGKREARAKVRTVTVTNEVERIIHAKPAPVECRLEPDVFNLLRVAVAVANNTDTDTTKPVPTSGNPAIPSR